MKKYLLLIAFLLFGSGAFAQATPAGLALSQWNSFLFGSGGITLAGNFATSGAYAATLTLTGTTNVTLPTSGTLVNSAVTSLPSLATVSTLTGGATGAGFTVALGTSTITGQLGVANGGTGQLSLGLNGVLIGNATSGINVVTNGTSGQVLTANTGSAPTYQNPAGFPVTAITADQTAVANTEYIDNKASTALSLSVPTSPTVGNKIVLTIGTGVTGAKIVGIASVGFKSGSQTGTTGTGAYVIFNSAGGSCTIEYTATNVWTIISGWGDISIF